MRQLSVMPSSSVNSTGSWKFSLHTWRQLQSPKCGFPGRGVFQDGGNNTIETFPEVPGAAGKRKGEGQKLLSNVHVIFTENVFHLLCVYNFLPTYLVSLCFKTKLQISKDIHLCKFIRIRVPISLHYVFISLAFYLFIWFIYIAPHYPTFLWGRAQK